MPAHHRAACPSPIDGQQLVVTNPAVVLCEMIEFRCCLGVECSETVPLVEFAVIPEAGGTLMLLAGCVALSVLGRRG